MRRAALSFRAPTLAWGLLGALLLTFWVRAVVLGSEREWSVLVDGVAYNLVTIAAAIICGTRAARRVARAAWLSMGIGLAAWAAADVVASVTVVHQDPAPFPALPDALHLAAYPAIATSLVLLAKTLLPRARLVAWMDAGTIALCVVAVTLVAMAEPLSTAWQAEPAATAVLLAYPFGDAALLGLAAGVLAMAGWAPGRGLALVLAGIGAVSVADMVATYAAVAGVPGALDLTVGLWPAGVLLVAYAAWHRAPAPETEALDRTRAHVVPAAAALASVGVLAWDHVAGVPHPAFWAALAAILLVIGRGSLSLVDSLRRLAGRRTEALTDELTGLGNRRRLMDDLTTAAASAVAPRTLLLLDLDGFKAYNDTNGHSAGDALLADFGRRLDHAVAGRGRSYRLGGDEFCVLGSQDAPDADALEKAARAALSYAGEMGRVTASCGRTVVGLETRDAVEALRIADERLYADKDSSRGGATAEQLAAVLVRVIEARDLGAAVRGAGVGDLASAAARRMSLPSAEVHAVGLAARLCGLRRLAPGAHGTFSEGLFRDAPALAAVAGLLDDVEAQRVRLPAVRLIAAATAYVDLVAEGLPHQAAVVELLHRQGRLGRDAVEAVCGVAAELDRAARATWGPPSQDAGAVTSNVSDGAFVAPGTVTESR